MEQFTPRKFVALSVFERSEEDDAICIGSWQECVQACAKDKSAGHVVELLQDEDGDEVQSCELLFVNKAWNRRYVK
jgi:hypothetical protein